jgi:outer membrane usher protein
MSMVFPVLLSSFSVSVFAGNDFEEAFLRRDKNGVSQDVFMYQDPVIPGRKLTDIVINDRLRAKTEIDFVSHGNNKVIPCLSYRQLKASGIRVSQYSGWITREGKRLVRLTRKPPHLPAAKILRCEYLLLLFSMTTHIRC